MIQLCPIILRPKFFLLFKSYLHLYYLKAIFFHLLLSIYVFSLHCLQLLLFPYLSTEIALSKVINEFLLPKYNIFQSPYLPQILLLFCTGKTFFFLVSSSYKGRIWLDVWYFVNKSQKRHYNDDKVHWTYSLKIILFSK